MTIAGSPALRRKIPKESRKPAASRATVSGPLASILGSCDVSVVATPIELFARRVLPLVVTAAAAISVPVLIFSPSGLARLHALREERVRADEEVTRLAREIDRLRAEVRRIKEDPAYVERAARDELGLLRQTEVVFQFRK
jgi:cell division protein FtsB